MCECAENYKPELSRLEVLTDLLEFAAERRAAGSLYTDGWADYQTVTKWREIVGYLRTALPDCAVRCFDEDRERKKAFIKRVSDLAVYDTPTGNG